MSGKEKGKEVECAQEDGGCLRKPGRTRGRVTEEKGKGFEVLGLNHMMTDDELDRYMVTLEESEDYDVEWPSNCVACGGITPIALDGDDMEWLLCMASQALDEYNKKKRTRLALVKIEKANQGNGAVGLNYYITFHVADLMPKKGQRGKAEPIVFQARVESLSLEGEGLVHQVRPKPTTVKTSKKVGRRA